MYKRFHCALIAAVLASPVGALAQAPAVGDEYRVPLEGLSVMPDTFTDCETLLGVTACYVFTLTVDENGTLGGSMTLDFDGAIDGDLVGPVSGAVRGVGTNPRNGRPGRTVAKLNIDTAGDLVAGPVTFPTTARVRCRGRIDHVDSLAELRCRVRVCIESLGCDSAGALLGVNILVAAGDAELVVSVTNVDGAVFSGTAEVVDGATVIANLVMTGKFNAKKAESKLKIVSPTRQKSKGLIKRLTLDAGGVPTGGEAKLKVEGHATRTIIAP